MEITTWLILGGLALVVCFFLGGACFTKKGDIALGAFMMVLGIVGYSSVAAHVVGMVNAIPELKDGTYQIRLVAIPQDLQKDFGVLVLREEGKFDLENLPRYYKIPEILFCSAFSIASDEARLHPSFLPKIGTIMTITIQSVKPVPYRELVIKEVLK